ncbi:hypothetical protein ACLB2K_044589 [Fragaria x ananassa]
MLDMKAGIADEVRPGKPRWGELDEDDGDLDFLLPSKEVIGPDENGVKKVIEYKFNDEGRKVKITTTFRTRKLARARLSKQAVERRSWVKFGDAVKENAGKSRTLVSTEEIHLERPKALGMVSSSIVLLLVVARRQNQNLWPPKTTLLTSNADTKAPEPGKTAYIPPRLRPGVDRSEVKPRRNDENSVRVTNLSEDIREADLRELFEPFGGEVSRVYVALDKETQVSRGFGFVNFVRREDGQKAINKLNGYGYDNLILSVEWAAPRPN